VPGLIEGHQGMVCRERIEDSGEELPVAPGPMKAEDRLAPIQARGRFG